jgi:hypothetical protein
VDCLARYMKALKRKAVCFGHGESLFQGVDNRTLTKAGGDENGLSLRPVKGSNQNGA